MSKREKLLLFVSIILCIALTGTMYINSQKPSQFVLESSKNDFEIDEDANEIEEVEKVTIEPELIGIHIGGQVKNPGFIWIEDGKRLYDALQYVGGALDEADLDSVNLSKRLMDEEKVYIPKKGEIQVATDIHFNNTQAATSGIGILANGKVNINTAMESELNTLPGIGEVLAKRILDYRSTNGFFKTTEDIRNVTGIGEKRFNDIKDLITVK